MIDGMLEPYGWLTGAYGFQVDLSTVALRLLCCGTLDRLVFGSDYPSFDFVRALDNVRGCGLPAQDIERILRGNATGLL